jgi:sialidase-1
MNRYLLIALSVAVLVSCGKSTGEESKKEEKKDEFVVAVSAPDIFVGKNDGYNTFRIPAIVKSKDGTLLAFCEGRKNSGSDTGDIDLLLRRSIDGGNKWSRIITVWDDGSNTCGNPTPVVDPETGRIHLLMTWNFATDGKSAGDFNNTQDKA